MEVTPEIAESMGVSRQAYDEVIGIVGHLPTIDELSTLLAIWHSNGCQQSLYGWLKGQQHTLEQNDYLYYGDDTWHKEVKEPKAKECRDILCKLRHHIDAMPNVAQPIATSGLLLYQVGAIDTDFLDSEYARQYLHLSHNGIQRSKGEDNEYNRLILDSLEDNGVIKSHHIIGTYGLMGTLVNATRKSRIGFDILTCREVRLDAFLFGESEGRYVVALEEKSDECFLTSLDQAGVNCCFLGRTTKGRILVDGIDFGTNDDGNRNRQ